MAKGNRGGKTRWNRTLNLSRDMNKNSAKVQEWLTTADSIGYSKKNNMVYFFRHEGQIGQAKNVDNMNMRQVAKNYKMRYDEW